ncbi:Bud-site selection protein [Amylostereum chailletii]|nr:Bud-site selection protein [Amylostereum chailletii]
MGTERRGLKRKREDDLEGRLRGKLHHGLREVRKAAKKAKTFETQKLVKRLKGTSIISKDDAGRKIDLEGQLDALKGVDHDVIGTMALASKLKKDKVLQRYPEFQSAMSQELPATLTKSSGLTSQLEARLLSSKALSSGVHDVVASLRSIVQPASRDDEDEDEDEDDSTHLPTKSRKLEPSSAVSVVANMNKKVHEDDMLGDVDEGDFTDRGEPDGGWESGTVDEENEDSDGGSDEVDDDRNFDAPGKSTAPRPVNTAAVEPKVKGLESTFLPSLSVGFTRGDSESEWSDNESQHPDGVRKNRRGQRARRAIWEKKYGRGAKHLNITSAIPQAVSKPSHRTETDQKSRVPNTSWAAKTNPPASHNTYQHTPRQGAGGNGFQPPHASNLEGERPMHPSWEAKKRLKEKESAAILPAQGTRIKFDS